MNASVQARLELLALEGGIARFGAAQPGHAVSVLDVVGSDASMSTADDATQEELLAGRAQFLNAQTTAFQVLVRTEPVDLEGHLRRVQARAELLAEPLASVARDYVDVCADTGIPAHAARAPLLRGPARPDRATRRFR